MTSRALLFVALAGLVSAGCPSNVIHDTKLPDRSGSVSIVEEIEGQYVVALGGRYGPYDGVGVESLQPSPDGKHAAWAASQEGAWSLFIDGAKRGEPWEGIGEVVWSPASNRLLYAATMDKRWQIVERSLDAAVPEDRGSTFGAIAAGSTRFSRNGAVFGYIGVDSGEAFVITSTRRRGPFGAAGGFALDDDGGHVAFTSLEADGAYVNVDAERYGPFADVAELVLAPRLGRFAASVMPGSGGWCALVDGRLGEQASKIGHFTFARDASRLAWAAADERDGRSTWLVHVDDGVLGPFDDVDHRHLAISDDARSIAFSASKDGKHFVVKDGKRLDDHWKRTELLSYAASSSILAYVGVDDRGASVVLNEEVRGRYDLVSDLAVAPSGASWLAAAERSGASLLVKDGAALRFDVVAAGTLAFDSKGRHWGALVGDKSDRSMWFVIDGKPAARLSFEDLANLVQARRDTDPADRLTKQLRAWVAVALTRAR